MSEHSILIVEDEMIVQMHLEHIVAGLGHRVSGTAVNAEEALRSACEDPPELVLMDIRLADGDDGVKTAAQLRERHGCAVIFVTAHADPATVERTGAVGPSGYVVKPFTGAEVSAAISTAMAGRAREAGGPPIVERTRPPPAVRRPFGAGTRLLVYSHDSFGLGHLRRCLKLITTLSQRHPDLSTLLVTGSPMVHQYRLPPGTDYLKLPAARKIAPNSYEARALSMSDQGIVSLRRDLLLRTIRDYDPNVLLVDHSPTGMKGELLPSLEWLRRRGICTPILGLRDVIDDPERVVSHWTEQGIYDVLRNLYDHLVVYGCQELYDPTQLYRFPPDVAAKTSFVHYIGDDVRAEEGPQRPADDGRPIVAVSIGGGDGGAETVVGPFLDMLARHRRVIGFRAEIVTGPFLAPDTEARVRSRARQLDADLTIFTPELAHLYRRAALVVSTAGYNTTTEVLSHARRAILIPRVLHRDEQLIRARLMAELGLATCLHPNEVTPERLLQEICSALDRPEPLPRARTTGAVPLDGAERFADFCRTLQVASPVAG